MCSRFCSACHQDCHVPHSRGSNKSYLSSKNVLDIRIVPGHPHNAWIECYKNSYDIDAQPGTAKHHAQVESEKVKLLLLQKEDKLKHFQQEVSKRVNYIQKMKRQEEKLRTMKLIEDEQTVLYQRTVGLNVQGKSESFKSLNHGLLKSCNLPLNNDKQSLKMEESNLLLEETAEKIKSQSQKAKAALWSKKVDGDYNLLPGGLWTKSPTKTTWENKSHDDSININPQKSLVNSSLPDTWNGMHTFKSTMESCEDLLKRSCFANTKQLSTVGQISDEGEDEEKVVELGPFHMNLVNDKLNRGHLVEQEKFKQNQYWKFRKIFMDIERDQVREKRRRQHQRQKVEKLKLHKELERRFEEERLTEFREETLIDDEVERDHNDKFVEELPLHLRSSPLKKRSSPQQNVGNKKEVYRYIEALLKTAKERVELCNIFVPPICSCSPTIWDSHPDKCANNCVFHRNPKEYIKALTTALRNSR